MKKKIVRIQSGKDSHVKLTNIIQHFKGNVVEVRYKGSESEFNLDNTYVGVDKRNYQLYEVIYE